MSEILPTHSLPTVALVGRPNVGKSTLFNLLTSSRKALVFDQPGVTKDRQYAFVIKDDYAFSLIDTPGAFEADAAKHILSDHLQDQIDSATTEADLILFIFEADHPPSDLEVHFLRKIQKIGTPYLIVLNKIDRIKDYQLDDFYRITHDFISLSAVHRRGLQSLREAILIALPSARNTAIDAPKASGIRMSVVGRPNVGKSTLINRMIGENRMVAFDKPGTTMDSIEIPFNRLETDWILIDTAGVRRRRSMKVALEKFSVLKTFEAIVRADVVLVLVDAQEGLVEQDIHLLEEAHRQAKPTILVINKWDHLSEEKRKDMFKQIDFRFRSQKQLPFHFISAKHGTGVGDLFEMSKKLFDAASTYISTRELFAALDAITTEQSPPLQKGKRPKIKLIQQVDTSPPTFKLHGNRLMLRLPESYMRYLVSKLRKRFKLGGVPMVIKAKASENPYGAPQGANANEKTEKTWIL